MSLRDHRDAQHLQQLPSSAGSQHIQAWQIGSLWPIRPEKCIPRNALEEFEREKAIANVRVNKHSHIRILNKV